MNSTGDLPSAAATKTTTTDSVRLLVSDLLLSSITARSSFFGRWQLILRPKLTSLLTALVFSSNWPQPYHPLLLALIPDLLSTLYQLKSLAHECCSDHSLPTRGKLHIQSDLDMASAALSAHLHHLHLLLRSGILDPQSSSIFLSQPAPLGSPNQDVQLLVKDLFLRLQLGGVELKNKALQSLLQLLRDDDAKFASVVAKYGNIACLIKLLDPKTESSTSEHAVSAVSILASADDESRRQVILSGGLDPLLKILESGSDSIKEKAAIAVEAITTDSKARLTYGGVGVLVKACRSGPPAAQSHALGAIRNVAAVTNVRGRAALVCEGAIPLLLQLLSSGKTMTQQNAASCLAIFAASGDDFRTHILQERGLRKLMAVIQESPNYDVLEGALSAITSLSESPSAAKILSSSVELIMRLGTLIKHRIPKLQHLSTSLLANLSIGDRGKRGIARCMNSLIRLMESPKPAGVQESATLVLVSLLSVKSNSREMVTDDKSLVRLVQMLDPRNDSIPKKLPVTVVSAILDSGINGCRRRLVDAGAYTYMKKLTQMEVAGAKKAAQRLSGNKLKTILRRTWEIKFPLTNSSS